MALVYTGKQIICNFVYRTTRIYLAQLQGS